MINLRKYFMAVIFLSSIFFINACGMSQNSDVIKLTADLTAEKEVPPTNSKGNGKANLEYSKKIRELRWTINYEGLTGPITAAHFHGPATVSENAEPTIPIEGNLASPIIGTAILTATEENDLMKGKWYLNLHTAANPKGEIRAQISDVH
ncbi:MAG: CHRD domain-containing protein [Methylotenera sp.]